ncbi:hypothetical protein [Rhodovulum sulfidophilum]|uniref:Uncharacterized protein n=1 Tax=Rhodovulum sulfidophilum TaxID=35806 RepID=A0ABS1RYJ8_RHOSU|nr:hypothetical protein [Rhodovulum sulfidophilum]MBL3610567.1 hypothetical protein [Rhodovulum sulfidophilum]MCE8455491.1 hypothetical protein [Rhodovulum sulfidophilum]
MVSCPVIAICGPAPLAGIPGLRRAAPPVTARLLAAAVIPAPAQAAFGPGAALTGPLHISAFQPVERPVGPGGAPEALSRDRGAEGGEQ